MPRNIRVLIVDDSAFFRNYLQTGLSKYTGIEVVDTAANTNEARDKIMRLNPDVVTMDVEMPGMNGIDFLRSFLPTHPVHVVVITSSAAGAFDAVSAGAVEFMRKPEANEKEQFIARLASTVRFAQLARIKTAAPAASAMPRTEAHADPIVVPGLPRKNVMIALGASTGGTDALVEIVRRFPANTPPVVITQHMPPTFTKMFADRVNRICAMSAKEAEDGDRLITGRILVAAGGLQMRVMRDGAGYYVSCRPGAKVSGHCPSVDVLFDSVADAAGANAVAAILTGMGEDGARGLLKLHNTGAYTIGQDEETCVVYGMPAVAFKKGAVSIQLPLHEIAKQILTKVR
ncbi:MAG: chemotaxis response regulator protein-glutamate methylesterase [Bacteroides sp.]|nr:chemotaxis response regulator protein-glutamate methylesterase [Eubacterium sp.]MCM1418838.1 chemotaxis response regulator protein-glutamate methylesterase [Roseburia sp.]MCM1462885.1 chemotaxis response regulator protein-glutamate methylesterase [Bacteroides sp.]